MSKRRKEEVTPPTFNEVVQQLSKGRIDETVVNQVQGRPVPQQTEFDLEETGQTWADQTPAEIRDQRAARQPNSRAIANSLFQIGTTIAGDTVAGIGYLGELKDIQDIVAGTETEWGNWLTDIGDNIKEWGQDVAPVYASESAMQGFKPWDGEWWATNIPSIGSTFALMLPAAGAAGITSKLLGRAGNAAKIAGKLSTTQKVLPGISAAVTSRHIENMMEGKEVFDTVYNEAIQAGKSDPEARKIAGNAASQSYNTNYVNLLTDIPQYLAAGGFFGKLAGGTGKKAIGKELLSSVGQESVEEALQFVISKEAERTGRLDIEGKEEDGTNFGQRLTNYLQDPQLWTASFFGALGGGMFTAGSRAIEKTVDLIATDPAERQDKAMMNLVEDAIDKGDFNQLKTAVAEMRKANPEDLGMSPEVYNKNLDKLDQLAKHAESFYSSAPAEFRQEATKLGVKAKKLELDKLDTQTQIESIKANVSDTKAFDAYMNELQLAALSNNTSKQAKEYKAQLEKSLEDVEYNKSDFAAYSSQMRQAAKKMAISSVEAMKTNEELMKYETPEGQQEIAKAKAKQAEAKAKQEYQEALAKAEQATTPEEIENSPITDEDKGRLFSEKLVQDKKNIAQSMRAIPKNSIESREQAESFADSMLSNAPFLNRNLDSSRRNDLVNKLLQEYGQTKAQKEVQSQQEQTPQKDSRIETVPEGAQSHYTRRNGQREDVSKRTDANKGAGWYRQNGTRVGDLDYINEATDNYFSEAITDPETGQTVTEGEDITSWDQPTEQDIAEGVVDQEATDLLNADPVQEIFNEKDKAEAQEEVEEQVENVTEDEPQTIEPYDKPEQGGDLLGTSREAEAEPNVAVFHDIAMAILLPNGKYKLYGYGKPWLEYTEEQLSDYILPKVEGKSQPLKYKANNNPVPTEWQSKYLNSESNLEMVRAFAESMPDWRDREVFIEINDDTYKDNANEIKMHLIMVRDDTKKVYLGLLRNPANTADSAKLAAIREQIYAEYVAQGKPETFRSGVTTSLSQVSTGRVWNTNQRNKPADVLGDDLIAGIGITAGETTELVTNGTDIRRGSGRVAPVNNPTAGGVYLAVDSADGGQIWYRAFTKRLDSESYIQENELPVFEEIFGYEQVTYLEAIRRLLGVAQSNPDLWKNRWSDIRNEIRSIVRFNNKGKIQPDFRANFAEFLNEKHGGSVDNYLTSLNTRFNFYSLPLQVDSRKINTGNYNELVLNNRVEIDVNPDQHTHSTQFSVDLDSVELGVVEEQDFENDFEGEDLDSISFQLGGEPIGTKEQAIAYLESILPNVPVHILDKTLRIGNQEAFGYFSNAGITLLRNAGLNTAKHEAAHIVFEFGLSEREQRRLLEQAKSSFSLTKDDLDRARLALSKLNSDRTPEQYALIEKIMEEFETYTISGDTSLAGRVKSIFKRLLEYLKMVFTNRISLDGFYYRIDSGLYKNIDLSSVSSDYQPAFKLHGFRSEAERQTRVKSTVSMLDRIIKSIADVDKISIDDAYRKALANLDNIFTGDMLSYGGSIKQRIEQRATKVNKPESFNLYLSAIENPDFRQSVLAKMSTRGVKVKFEPEDISTENEDAVENWQKSTFQYSQLKSMSARLRRALSVLPVLKTPTVDVLTKMAKKRPSVIVSNIKELNELDNEVNHIVSSSSIVGSRLTDSGWHKVNIDGTKHYLRDVFVPEYDDLGFIKMHEGSKIYGDLQYKLGDSASPKNMMDRLNNLQDYHYKFLLSKLDSSLATELWYYVGQKNQPEFNDIVNVDGTYGIRSSGTDNVLNKVLNDSFDYFSNSNYYDNGEVKNADKIKTLVNKVRKSESPDAIVELNNMLFGLDNNVLLNMNVNDYLTKMTNAALAIANGNLDFNNRQFKNFFKIVAENYPVNFQSSHINIEGEKIFEWINSSFLGKMVAKLKSGEFNWDFYRNDPMYSRLINKGVIDPKVWAKARWSIIGGVKHNKKGAGVTYNNFSDKDSAIALYSMVKEGWYNTSILSDAPVMTAINLGKKSTTEAVNDLFELAIAEDIRNKNIDKHKSKFGRYAAEFSFFEGNEMPTKSDIQRQIKEEADKLERKFMELGLIENGKMVIDGSTIDTSIMQNLVANYMLNESQIILMTQGDPAFYKGSADFFKRAKEVWSPGNYMDTTASYTAPDGTVTTYPSNGKYNVGILKDIEMPSPQLEEMRKALAGRDQDTIDRLTAAYGYSNDKDDKGKPIVRLSDGTPVRTENPNLANAQGIIDILTYKMRLLGENRWSHAKEFAYRMITQGVSPRSKNLQAEIDAFTTDQQIRDKIKKELGSIVFQPIKPFYFAHHLLNNVLVYPVQNKDSEYLLTPMFAQGNPELESVLTKMGYTKTDTGWVLDVEGRMNGRYVDKFVFESGIKIPLGDQIDTLENIDDTKYIQFNWSDYRRQMETPAHYVDTDNNFGTQIMKLIFADVETEDLLEAKREYNRLIQEDIRRSLSELKSRLYKEGELDTQAVVNILREEVLERGLSDQYIEALEENTLDAIEGVNTKLPLYHPLHSYRIEAIINSLYKNRVTKQKFLQGVALYNVSSYGLSKKPKIVYENGRIKHIQAYAPVYTKALEKYRLEDGTIDIDTIRKQAPEMLEGLVYRIPTEDKYSMFHIKIIGFTDDAAGGGIILPPEVTTIAGLDFDIDKVYGFFNAVDNPYDKAVASLEKKIQSEFDKTDITSLTDEEWNNVFGKLYEDRAEFDAEVRQVIAEDIAGKGKYEKLKRRQEQWQAKADSDNRKLELMRQVLSHKSMIENILTPGGFEQIRSVSDVVKKAQGISDDLSINKMTDTISVVRRMNTGKALTGIAANYNVARALWQGHDLSLDSGFMFDKRMYTDLSSVTIYGIRPGRSIAEILAAAVDNGKDPLAEFINLNTYTADLALTMLATGMSIETVALFMSQPIVKQYANYYFNNDQEEAGLPTMSEVDEEFQPHPLTTEELKEGLSEMDINAPYDPDAIVPELQLKVIENFVHYMQIAKPVSMLVGRTKIPDSGTGPTQADNVDSIVKYDEAKIPDPDLNSIAMINGATDYLRANTFMNTFYESTFPEVQEVFKSLGFPKLTRGSSFYRVMDKLKNISGDFLSANEINRLLTHFLDYLSYGFETYNPSNLVNLNETVKNQLFKYKKYLKDNNLKNDFVDRLSFKDGAIQFNGIIGVESTEETYLRNLWYEMLSNNQNIDGFTIADLANNLIKYSFFRTGFRLAGKKGFSHLHPVGYYATLVDSNGQSFNQYITKQIQSNNGNDPAHDVFVEQYIRNNYRNLSYVPFVEVEQGQEPLYDLGHKQYIKTNKGLYKVNHVEITVKFIPDLGQYYQAPLDPMDIVMGAKPKEPVELFKEYYPRVPAPTSVFNKEAVPIEKVKPEIKPIVQKMSAPSDPFGEGQPEPQAKVVGEPTPIVVNGIEIVPHTYKNEVLHYIKLNDDQRQGLQKIANHVDKYYGQEGAPPFVLMGKAGTGKTTLVKTALQYIEAKHKFSSSIILTNTHRAGIVASQATYNEQGRYKTLASAFYANNMPENMGNIIFDEVSMNDSTHYSNTKKYLLKNKTLPIFVGDIRQIPPVKSTEVSQFFKQDNVHELNEIMRFGTDGPIFRIADTFAENLLKANPVDKYPKRITNGKETVESYGDQNKFIAKMLDTFSTGTPTDTKVVTYSNNSVRAYGEMVRNRLFGNRKGDFNFNSTPFKGEPIVGNLAWSIRRPKDHPILNSMDYEVIESAPNQKGRSLGITINVAQVTIRSLHDNTTNNIQVIDPDTNSAYIKKLLSVKKEWDQTPARKRYNSNPDNILHSLEMDGIYLLEPIYGIVDSQGNVTITKDQNKANVTLDPNAAFGYASTAHKVQGGTYKNVFVDEVNLSLPKMRTITKEGKSFGLEKNMLKYVAFSRASDNLFIYTDKPIDSTQQSQPVQKTATVKPTQQPVTQTTPVGKVTGMFDSSDKTLKPGAVVTYNNKKYILWNINNANKAQLIQTDGTKFSGTPNLDKLTVDGNYPIANYNGTDYIVTNNGNIYSLANGNRRWTSDAQASIDARNSIYSQVGYTEVQEQFKNLTTMTNQIYSKLNDKTQSENVVIDKVNGRKPAIEKTFKRGDIFEFQLEQYQIERVTDAGFDVRNMQTGDIDFITKEDFNLENQSSKPIIAYRTRGNNFLEALEKDNAIGNPWNSRGYGLYKTDSVEQSVKEFIAWMIGEKHTDKLQDYRQEILNNLDKMKGITIMYYQELNQPSHATALDYLINKYDWIIQPVQEQSTQEQTWDTLDVQDMGTESTVEIINTAWETYSERIQNARRAANLELTTFEQFKATAEKMIKNQGVEFFQNKLKECY